MIRSSDTRTMALLPWVGPRTLPVRETKFLPCPAPPAYADACVRARPGDFAAPSAKDGFHGHHAWLSWHAGGSLAAYPQTNYPAVWASLHAMIRASPLLSRQLDRIKRANWSVYWNLGNGSSCNPLKSRIDVDVATNAQVVVQNLAHEASHAFDPFVQPVHYANEGAYLSACMRNEATAVISHLFVRSEIHANGGLDIGILYSEPHYYEAAAAFYGRHRNYERLLQHVMAMYVWQVNSVERVCYWQTFMNNYRTHWRLPPPMRVDPFLPAYRHQTFQRLRLEMLAG